MLSNLNDLCTGDYLVGVGGGCGGSGGGGVIKDVGG